MANHIVNLNGKIFGRLTVLRMNTEGKRHSGSIGWICKCECGKIKSFSGSLLRRGRSKSCGCMAKELLYAHMLRNVRENRLNTTTHNMSFTGTYCTWASMVKRCVNSNCKEFKNYGGRGIKVCESWRKFENFYEDMGKKPEGMSLDRVDNDGDYDKTNCRWATKIEQANNTRRNRMIVFNGETRTMAEWSRITGIKGSVIFRRLKRGWKPEDALTIPVKDMGNKKNI